MQPDKTRGEDIVLFTTDEVLTRETLLKSSPTLGVAEIAVHEKIQPVDYVPTLSTGKTDYATLKDIAETV
jgi:acyl-[acyl-carrier-protein]-phospholipid O-acyltransferase/long-chain-fatty-acid--[acyl-carrier-protein] ligase